MKNPDPLPTESSDHAAAPAAVEPSLDSLDAFSVWMNVQLSQLVARWKHLAAPNAARIEQAHARRFSMPRKAK